MHARFLLPGLLAVAFVTPAQAQAPAPPTACDQVLANYSVAVSRMEVQLTDLRAQLAAKVAEMAAATKKPEALKK